jgi:pyruvate dehydrogenase E2 component (dihydrolipoamide acetyltransferase)
MLTHNLNMSGAIAYRTFANGRAPEGTHISITAVLIQACAWALRQHPILNSHFQDDEIILQPEVNVGVAVALEDGLIVPVVRRADQKGLLEIGAAVADLSERARESRLTPSDVAGGTFTLSNLGMFGVDQFTAIINPPEVAILAVGRIAKSFVPDEKGQPVARPMMTVTLAVDHRVVDGAAAARFLVTFGDALRHPTALLL